MTGALIATAYLNALENEDVAAVLALFQPEAIVHLIIAYRGARRSQVWPGQPRPR